MNLLRSLARRATAPRVEVAPRVPALFEQAPVALAPTVAPDGTDTDPAVPSGRRPAAPDDRGDAHPPAAPAGPPRDPPGRGSTRVPPSDREERTSAPARRRAVPAEPGTAVDDRAPGAPLGSGRGVPAGQRSPGSAARVAAVDPDTPPAGTPLGSLDPGPAAQAGADEPAVSPAPGPAGVAARSRSARGSAVSLPVASAPSSEGHAAALPAAPAEPVPSLRPPASVERPRAVPAPPSAARRRPAGGDREPAAGPTGVADPSPAPLLAAPPPLRRPGASVGLGVPSSDDRGPEPAPVPTVSVTIGRIDVRAVTDGGAPAPARPERAARSALSLEEYLRQRSRGRGA